MKKDREYTIREQIKMMLLWRDISLSKLVRKLNKDYGYSDSQSNLSRKLIKNTIKYDEVKKIADILGYNIIFQEHENWQDWEE
ncbi:MAG: hypothetical protein A2Y25_03340 [Candidatus Melainabacteria bacterium GWF2_37_15]|nr:MAG: hypothetical protein A2Y25_03340 [Candidatus Melainabacteria bacterium GWF2_37_15]